MVLTKISALYQNANIQKASRSICSRAKSNKTIKEVLKIRLCSQVYLILVMYKNLVNSNYKLSQYFVGYAAVSMP